MLDAGPGESEYTRYDRKVPELASDWLFDRADTEEAWALFVSFVTSHYPFLVPQEFFKLYPIDAMPMPKLGHQTSFEHYPWFADILKVNLGADGSDEQHKTAYAAYLGLCSFMDAMVGQVIEKERVSGAWGARASFTCPIIARMRARAGNGESRTIMRKPAAFRCSSLAPAYLSARSRRHRSRSSTFIGSL